MVYFMSISSALAILNSVFFSAYLLQPRKRSLANLLLAFLLLALALRIFKSLTSVVFVDTSSFLLALGLGSMGTIGPMLYFYVLSFLQINRFKVSFIHFVLPVGMTLVAFSRNQLVIYLFYVAIIFQILIYIVMAIHIFKQRRHSYNRDRASWVRVVIGAVLAIWVTMLMQLIFDNSETYMATSIVAASLIYVLGFVGFNNAKLFSANGGIVDYHVYREISDKFHELLGTERIHRTQRITISEVAKQMEIPAYMISKSINAIDGKTFPEIIKEYRMKDIKQNLRDPANRFVSIDALAFETGFTSISKFYKLFRKETGLTPDQFRRLNP